MPSEPSEAETSRTFADLLSLSGVSANAIERSLFRRLEEELHAGESLGAAINGGQTFLTVATDRRLLAISKQSFRGAPTKVKTIWYSQLEGICDTGRLLEVMVHGSKEYVSGHASRNRALIDYVVPRLGREQTQDPLPGRLPEPAPAAELRPRAPSDAQEALRSIAGGDPKILDRPEIARLLTELEDGELPGAITVSGKLAVAVATDRRILLVRSHQFSASIKAIESFSYSDIDSIAAGRTWADNALDIVVAGERRPLLHVASSPSAFAEYVSGHFVGQSVHWDSAAARAVRERAQRKGNMVAYALAAAGLAFVALVLWIVTPPENVDHAAQPPSDDNRMAIGELPPDRPQPNVRDASTGTSGSAGDRHESEAPIGASDQPVSTSQSATSQPLTLRTTLDGDTLHVSLLGAEDLSPQTPVSVSICRSYWELGNASEYSRCYLEEGNVLRSWRNPVAVSVADAVFLDSLSNFQEEMSQLGGSFAFTVDRIDEQINVYAIALSESESSGGRRSEVDVRKPLAVPADADLEDPRLSPDNLKPEAIYEIGGNEVPLIPGGMLELAALDPMDAIRRMVYLPSGSSFMVIMPASHRGTPGYAVVAFLPSGDTIGVGWINEVALYRAELRRIDR